MSQPLEALRQALAEAKFQLAVAIARQGAPGADDATALKMLGLLEREGLTPEVPELERRAEGLFVQPLASQLPVEVAVDKLPDGFDFLIVPTLRGGSRAIEIMLNLHPELHAAPRIQVDEGILRGQWDQVGTQARTIRRHIPNLQSGLVLHDGLGLMAAFRNLTRAVASDRPWVQVVREPYSALLSSINHGINGEAHGYYFPKVGLPWCLDEEITTAPELPFEPARIALPLPNDHARILAENLPRKMDHRNGLPFSQYFDSWNVLDVADLSPDRLETGLARLFTTLGVDASFQHPAFHRVFHGKLPRYMYMNPARVTFFGYPLVLCLGAPGDSLICRDLKGPDFTPCEYVELLTMEHNAHLSAVGVPEGTCTLMVDAAQWQALPQKVRALLSFWDLLERYAVQTLIPRWASHVAAIEAWVGPAQVQSLTRDQRNTIHQAIKEDQAAFLRQHSDLAERWAR
jgi:hypothetical protein